MEIKHGGNIYEAGRKTGLKSENIIDFSASINPIGFSGRFKKALSALEASILNYPDLSAYAFRAALSEYHGLPAENILVGNGSTEFIYLLPGILRPKSVLVVAPAFTEYEHSYQRAKGVVFYLKTTAREKFVVQQKVLFEELKRGYSALYICNPASPTGVLTPARLMKDIIAAAHKKGTATIVDETFIDFNEEHSVKAQVNHFDNLFILRSMTKFFALPGLRLGYALAHNKNIEKLREKQQPWSTNAIAQRAGLESLKDQAHIQKTIQYVTGARKVFAGELKKLPGLTVFPSAANFLLVKIADSAPVNAVQVCEKLQKRGILIRTCEDFQGLDETYFRAAVKKKNENKRLVSELKKILS